MNLSVRLVSPDLRPWRSRPHDYSLLWSSLCLPDGGVGGDGGVEQYQVLCVI